MAQRWKKAGSLTTGGMSLNVFTQDEMDAIHRATLEVLEHTGVLIGSPEARALLVEAGASVIDEDIVRFPQWMVADAVSCAPETLLLAGRTPDRDVVLDSTRVMFTNFGEAVYLIDPDTGEVLPDGTKGELVFTSITKEAFPLLRYRTRDICVLDRTPCSCGRTHVRMAKPMGRSDDMLIIRGVNVFPSQIEEVLLKVSGENITPNYQIIVGRENNTDTLDINVEMSEQMFSDDIRSVETLEKKIVSQLRSMLGIGAKVHLVNPKTIARSEGKAQRIIDNRKL